MKLRPEQEALVIHHMRRAIATCVDGHDTRANELTDVELCEIARAIIPLICNAAAAAERERCLAAVRSERLEEPQPGTSDEAYQQALSDAEAAIRALPSMEADDERA
jgi:hypothetical protein